MEKLYIVIPAYNEEMNITSVAREWHTVVETISEDSKLVIIDDGSKDSTYQVLTELSKELPQLEVITKRIQDMALQFCMGTAMHWSRMQTFCLP